MTRRSHLLILQVKPNRQRIHMTTAEKPNAPRFKCRTATQSRWPRGSTHKLGQCSCDSSSRKNWVARFVNDLQAHLRSYGQKRHENSCTCALCQRTVTLLQKKSNVWATLKYTIGVSREVHPRNCREQEGAAEIMA